MTTDKTPRISIVTNSKNGEHYLPDLFNTIDAQTFSNWEHIFFDNNSSDNTESLCKERLNKIEYYNSNEDLPLSVARNIAISKCKGEYVAILDCDDLWDKNKLFAQIKIFEKYDHIDLCSTDYSTLINNRVIKAKKSEINQLTFKKMLNNYLVCHSSVMFKRLSLIKIDHLYDKELHIAHDKDLILRLVKNHNIYHITEYLTFWRFTNESLTNSRFDLLAKDNQYILNKYQKTIKNFNHDYKSEIEKLDSKIKFHLAIFYWINKDKIKLDKILKKNIRKPKFFMLMIATYFFSSKYYTLIAKSYINVKKFLRK